MCNCQVKYLRYHSMLEFRGFVSARAIHDVYEEVMVTDSGFDPETHFQEMHSDAVMYYLAIQELSEIGMHKTIHIGQEISSKALKTYDDYLHDKVFPPPTSARSKVTEFVMDGHAKVHEKCAGAGNHAGKPRKNGKTKPYGHGWFMALDPQKTASAGS